MAWLKTHIYIDYMYVCIIYIALFETVRYAQITGLQNSGNTDMQCFYLTHFSSNKFGEFLTENKKEEWF